MSYVIEIDQSGRFENTKTDTVIAFSNNESYSVLIPAAVKRDCITVLRARGISGKTFYLRLFTICLFYLLKNHIQNIGHVVIDLEYTGKNHQVKEYLINLIRRAGYNLDPYSIQFTRIGKKSTAHIVALTTWRGEKNANLVLTTEDILKEFETKRKSGTTLR